MLEVMDQVCFPSGKGDVSGTFTYDGDEWGKYNFALSFDERHGENDAEYLKKAFAHSAVVRLMDAVVSVFEGTEAESKGFLMRGILTRQVLSRSGRRCLL